MDLNLKKLDNCKREFSAELNYEELQPYFEKALLEYRKKAMIPGFRKGKAPLNMLKKLYNDSIEYAAQEDIANEVFQKYLDENKIYIVDKGALKKMDYKPKESFTFLIEFEAYPDIELKNFRDIEITSDKFIVSDSMVDDEIKNIRFRNATYELDGEVLDDEYRITIDTQALDDSGNIIVGDVTKDFKVYLGYEEIFPEFREGFKNFKENEERIIETKDSKDNPKKVKVKCTKVEKIIYPELNEDFFKKVTNKEMKSIDEFKEFIRNDIMNYYEKLSKRSLDKDIINEIIKQNDIEVPDVFVDRILNSSWEEHKKSHKKGKVTKEEEDEFKKNKRVDAIMQSKWFLIKEKLIETEKLKLEDEDYNKFAEDNIKLYNLPLPVEKIVQTYKENEDMKYHLLDDKIFDFLKSNMKITYVEKDLTKESDNKIIS